MPNPRGGNSQAWDDSDLSVYLEQQPDFWSEPAFADPTVGALAEGAVAFATGADIADIWVDADGGEPFIHDAAVVASTGEAGTVSWKEVGEGAPLGFENDNETVASDDWANWEALSGWAATEKTDGESQEVWAIAGASLDVQEGNGFEKSRVLQAQLTVEVDGADSEEPPGPEAEAVPRVAH
ncbi:hypothetical protein [Gloeobacter morelensis]|uniref:hypothetical protein n=1 Tax=Gloeobacter morelensis TaxID=2907343 RepID=UPI001E3AA251|nr:hypothetical protein [Gloeobacter morelensis]